MFELLITELQPSQLYVSEEKLRRVREWFKQDDKAGFTPIPIKLHNGKNMMTDGHTRAAAAYLAGWETVPVVWDEDDWDMRLYETCVKWCEEAGMKSGADLAERIISAEEYEVLWNLRCEEML